jgi:hypothetical protein
MIFDQKNSLLQRCKSLVISAIHVSRIFVGCGWKLEVGSWKLEVGGWRLEN